MTLVFGLTTFLPIGIVLGICAGPWILDSLARMQGGVWRHGGTFTCPRCEKRRRIARPGDIRHAVCIHCTAPQSGGVR